MAIEAEPRALMEAFQEICRIPHGSHDERRIAQWLVARLKAKGLDARMDESLNVYATKKASPGREGRPGVILQAHTDMVCQSKGGSTHDFSKDPIVPRRDPLEPDWMTATGTTLGADNGLGVAAMIAVLEDDSIEHGPLECLFTSCEEDGMHGARAVAPDALSGKYLLNLDGENEDEITLGCAGTLRVKLSFSYPRSATPPGASGFHAIVSGLAGGHSGVDIHKGRGNATMLLARILARAGRAAPTSLAAFEGGTATNAIPRDARAEAWVGADAMAAWKAAAEAEAEDIRAELAATDPGFSFYLVGLPPSEPRGALSPGDAASFFETVSGLPDGLRAMEADFPGIPRTSSNLGICTFAAEGDRFKVELLDLARSSIESEKAATGAELEAWAAARGGSFERLSEAPAWKPEPGSALLSLAKEAFQAVRDKEPELLVTHGGLECGLFRPVYPQWEMISFGPTIRAPHSPNEAAFLPSMPRFWAFLLELLARL